MYNHCWEKVRKFEAQYKAQLLRRMSQQESVEIFLDLYQLCRELSDKRYYFTLDRGKIVSLVRIHSLANEVR